MSTANTRASCGLDVGLATNLEFSIEKACSETYDFICSNVVDENANTKLSLVDNSQKIGGNTVNSFLLNSQVILFLFRFIDCCNCSSDSFWSHLKLKLA